jgi:hypothetical protein
MPSMIAESRNPLQRQFNPYTENGGTILAIAGADFSVIAGDTRQSEGYSIQTRYAPKVFRLCAVSFPLSTDLFVNTVHRQNGSRSARCQRLRSRRKHVREEGQTASGGDIIPLITLPPTDSSLSFKSGIDTPTQKTCHSVRLQG